MQTGSTGVMIKPQYSLRPKVLRSFPEGNSRSTQSVCLEKTSGDLLGVRGNCGSMKLCTDLNLKPRLSMTEFITPLHFEVSFCRRRSWRRPSFPHLPLQENTSFSLKYCASKSCLCQATKYLERHNRASRADKAVHVAEEALGDEREATSLLWALFLQSTRLTKGTVLAA